MEPRRRIQIHDHSDFNSGGLVAAHTIVRAAGVPADPTVTPGGSGSTVAVLDEGVPLDTAVTSIDFTGAGVTATNTGPAITVDIPGGSGFVPYYIALGDTFTVPLYSQALYAIPIDVDGTLAIAGILVEVD